MTTFQDSPLQSRRAVRQGERLDPSFSPPQVPKTAASPGEPLSYVTQNRPPIPGYENAPARGRRSASPEPAAAAEQPSAPVFRPRDFSPEARTAPPAWVPADDRDSGMLDHHTQVRPPTVTPPGSSLAESLASEPNEQTLTRRELRSLREGRDPAEPSIAAPVAAPPVAAPPVAAPPVALSAVASPAVAERPVEAPPAPEPSTQLASAMAEFDALTGQATETELQVPRRAGRRAAIAEDVAAPSVEVLDVHEVEPPSVVPPVPSPPVVQPSAFVEPAAAPTTGERPLGHWTNQGALDDRVQVTDSTVSRRVGSGSITTSALVLPSIPGHDLSTGEVVLTGSISLPSALSATGAHTAIDESDLDHLLDAGDHQQVNTDSVPIRAIRAVSSHTGTHSPLIATDHRSRGHRALTALIVSASGMVVVVVTLLVVALATEVI